MSKGFAIVVTLLIGFLLSWMVYLRLDFKEKSKLFQLTDPALTDSIEAEISHLQNRTDTIIIEREKTVQKRETIQKEYEKEDSVIVNADLDNSLRLLAGFLSESGED